MTSKENTQSILLPIFITVFIDMVGAGIAIPIFPALITQHDTAIVAPEVSNELRKIIFGFLSASFFFAQFFGAPILGAISDRDGRKKVLIMSLVGTMIGYLLFAFGIYIRSIEMLFLSRLVAGFMGGNISVALSMISDVSTAETKTKNFGLIGAAFGLGFIFGPALGGMLSNAEWGSAFTLYTPFIVSALLTTINIGLVMFNLPETIKEKIHKKIGIGTGIQNITKAFLSPSHRLVFLLVFLITFGFTMFTHFFNLFETEKYGLTPQSIGIVFSYVGIWSVIAQGAVVRPLSKRFSPVQILSISLLILAIALIAIILPHAQWLQYFIIPFIACTQGLTQPNINTIVTNSASQQEQGQILGLNQSVQSFAMAIPPMLAGFLSNIDIHIPNIAAAIFTFAGWAVLFWGLRSVNK
jgi:MFS transporter, DHA1 family, tetracycline resistance protein